MKNKIRNYVQNLSISRALIFSNLLTVVLPLVFVFFIVSNNLINLTSRQFMQSSSQTMDQASRYLSYKFAGAANITNITASYPEIMQIISQNPQEYRLTDQLFDAWSLKNYMESLRQTDLSLHIKLYTNDDLYFSNEEVLFYPISYILESQWFQDMVNKAQTLIWLPSDRIDSELESSSLIQDNLVKGLSVIRRINNLRSINETLFVMRVDVSLIDIETILSDAIVSKESHVWLLSNDGEIFATSYYEAQNNTDNSVSSDIRKDPKTEDNKSFQSLFLGEQFQEITGNAIWKEVIVSGEPYLVYSVKINDTPMNLVTLLPKAELRKQSDSLRLNFLLILLLVMIIMLLFSLRFSRRISSRLQQIRERMRLIQKGVMEPIDMNTNNDEIGDLAQTYNFMVSRISQLADESYDRGREALRQEMRALQGQINPHFLYNMLDLINLSAMDKEMNDLAETVRMLARFYRLGLSRGSETVTIKDELEHVTLYFRMQNLRFENRIKYEIDFPEEVLSYKILKIILQPIIENSILHGILSERNGHGCIWIKGSLNESSIIISIHDNGVGFNSDKISTILTNEGKGYGLYNVNRRLCLFYGDAAGLKIVSSQSSGTTVQFAIPREPDVNI